VQYIALNKEQVKLLQDAVDDAYVNEIPNQRSKEGALYMLRTRKRHIESAEADPYYHYRVEEEKRLKLLAEK
jgi:hypothetical protein